MGYLDRAISMRERVIEKRGPVLTVKRIDFSVTGATAELVGKSGRYDLKIIPEEKLLVFCNAEDGVKGLLFARKTMRMYIDKWLPRFVENHFWDYIIEGEYVPEENIVIFKIDNAKRV